MISKQLKTGSLTSTQTQLSIVQTNQTIIAHAQRVLWTLLGSIQRCICFESSTKRHAQQVETFQLNCLLPTICRPHQLKNLAASTPPQKTPVCTNAFKTKGISNTHEIGVHVTRAPHVTAKPIMLKLPQGEGDPGSHQALAPKYRQLPSLQT